MISSTKHDWGPLTSDRGLTLDLILFKDFFNSLSDGIEDTTSNFVEGTKLEATMEYRATLQRDLNRMENWLYRNLMEFNKSKCIILCLGWNNSTGQYRLGTTWLAGSCVEKVWLVTCWTWAIKCACVAMKTRCILDFISQEYSHQFRGSYSSLLVSTCEAACGIPYCPVWGSSLKGRHRVTRGRSVKSHQVN